MCFGSQIATMAGWFVSVRMGLLGWVCKSLIVHVCHITAGGRWDELLPTVTVLVDLSWSTKTRNLA